LNKSESTNFSSTKGKKKKKPSLFKHISNKIKGMKISNSDGENAEQKTGQKLKRPFCKCCIKHSHTTDNCFLWDQDKCIYYNKVNHLLADCYYKDKPKDDNKKGKAKENPHKHSRTEKVNAMDSNQSYAAIKKLGKTTPEGFTLIPPRMARSLISVMTMWLITL